MSIDHCKRFFPTVLLSLTLASLGALLVQGSVSAQSAEKQVKQGESLTRQGKYQKAAERFEKAIAEDGRDLRARTGLAIALIKMGRNDLAFVQAGQIVAIDALNAKGHALLGASLLRSGNFDVSIDEFRTALNFNPREPLAIAGMSEVDFYENRPQEAYNKIRIAAFLDPSEPEYLMQLARAASRLENYSVAANAYEQFLRIAPLSDSDKRERIKGLIQFFRYLGTTKLHRLSGVKVATIPFKLFKNRPYVEAIVNGKGPYRFVVDSGAGISVLSFAAAKALKLSPIAKGGHARAVGGPGSFPIVYGFVDSLQLGNIKMEAIPFYFRSVPVDRQSPDDLIADGYLGLSVLNQFILTIDYGAEKLSLEHIQTRKDEGPATEATEDSAAARKEDVWLRSTSNGLLSAVTFIEDGVPLNFIVDTGASLSVIAQVLIERYKWRDKILPNRTMRVLGAGGVVESAEVLYAKTLRVANLRKPNVVLPVLDFSPINETSGFEQMGILGGDFFKHFKLKIDFSRARLTLTPQSTLITVADGPLQASLVR